MITCSMFMAFNNAFMIIYKTSYQYLMQCEHYTHSRMVIAIGSGLSYLSWNPKQGCLSRGISKSDGK